MLILLFSSRSSSLKVYQKIRLSSIQVSTIAFSFRSSSKSDKNQQHQIKHKLNYTKPNSSTPNQTHPPYQSELNHTKPNSSIPNQIIPMQTKPDNFKPNLSNPNWLGMQCIAESYPAFACYLLFCSKNPSLFFY